MGLDLALLAIVLGSAIRMVLPMRWSGPIACLCRYSRMSVSRSFFGGSAPGDPAVGRALELEGSVQRFDAFDLARRSVNNHTVLHKEMDRLLGIEDEHAALVPRLRQAHESLRKRGEKLIKTHGTPQSNNSALSKGKGLFCLGFLPVVC